VPRIAQRMLMSAICQISQGTRYFLVSSRYLLYIDKYLSKSLTFAAEKKQVRVSEMSPPRILRLVFGNEKPDISCTPIFPVLHQILPEYQLILPVHQHKSPDISTNLS
jgi:hypothetical protein